jgi:hypothetical protein
MTDRQALCEKIRELYPDIGQCGLDLDVVWDEAQKAWVVDLKKGRYELKTFLDETDADSCMLGKKCVSLGIEIAQLRGNIERMREDERGRV